MSKDKILITSALPYINNIPHLGNIIGCVLSADVFSKYCKLKSYDSIYVCGTDDYGTATEIKALQDKVQPRELVNKYNKIHKEIYDWFNIEFDVFSGTATDKHTEITQLIFTKLYENGYITEEIVDQPFDQKENIALADRYIEGECPHCGSEKARADQCDTCGKLLDYEDLINPISKLSGLPPIIKKSKHMFIDLPNIEPQLKQWIETQSKEGHWSSNSYNIAKAWLTEGLKKRCITRDLKWGVPVPLKGWENKVLYVWFEAPIGYISITANKYDDWQDWWLNPKQVKLYQFMGKDNVPFHTVIFPSTLMGTKQDWTLLHHINTTEYLNYEGGKFSKSSNRGVFGNNAIESGVPADVWRYYLLINRPEQSDTNFSWDDFKQKLNNELVANLGNFVNRTMTFTARYFNSVIPNHNLNDNDNLFITKQQNEFKELEQLFENVKIKDALKKIMHISKNNNQYFQENKPWEEIKNDKDRCSTIMYVLLEQVKNLAIICKPYLPGTSKSIFKQLNIQDITSWEQLGTNTLIPGNKIGQPKILFNKIDDTKIKELKSKYGGENNNEKGHPFANVDLEVAEIIKVEKHPEANKLYIETLKTSDSERTIVSGLVDYYQPDELIGLKIILLKNLKPAKLRGVLSEGMLLAAENKNDEVEVLTCPTAQIGDKVTLGNVIPNPKDTIEFKEFSKIKIVVRDNKIKIGNDHLQVNDDYIKTKKIISGRVH